MRAKISESNNHPAFYVDPQERLNQPALEESEIKKVTDRFNQIFDDFMLDNIAEAQEQESIGLNFFDSREISINGLIKDGSTTYQLHMRDSLMFNWQTRTISLQRLDHQGYGREYWGYDLSELADIGVVTRRDKGDIRVNVLREQEIGLAPKYLSPSGQEDDLLSSELIRRQLDHIKNELKNNQLEKYMGLNNQPVSLVEINGLADFINQNRQSFIPNALI